MFDSVNQSVVYGCDVCFIVCTLQAVGDHAFPVAAAKNYYKEYVMPPKMPKYVHFAKICEKCSKAPNTRQSHIRVFFWHA